MSARNITIEYNDKVVRQFMFASIIWGAVGMLVGVLIASQLNFFQLNFNTSYLTFGRLRPLHTNAVIFALVGNMMLVGVTKTEPLRELVWESRKDPDHERQKIHDGAEDPHIARG